MRILKYVVLDILKNKIVIVYAIILALFSWSAFSLEDNSTKGLLTVLNIILLTVPLVSVLKKKKKVGDYLFCWLM